MLISARLVDLIAAPRRCGPPTFTKDVAPILFKNCVECHRPTAMAPMSLMTYEDARPWARAIKQKVVARQMPPWGADPTVAKVRERRQPEAGRDRHDRRVGRWRRARRQSRGSADGAAVRRGLVDRQAGLVFKMLKPFKVPADGTVPYVYISIPTNLKEDIWIRGGRAQADRSARGAPHHQQPGGRQRQGAGSRAEADARSEAQGDRRRPRRARAGAAVQRVRGRRRAEDSGRRRHRAADALHDDRPAGRRPDRNRRGPREGPAGEAARRGRRLDSEHDVRDSARRSELRGDRQADVQPRYVPEQPLSAHARARQGRDLHRRLSRWPRRSRAARAEVRLQLAVELQARRAEVDAEGIDAQGDVRTTTTRRRTASTRIRRRRCAGAIRPGKR